MSVLVLAGVVFGLWLVIMAIDFAFCGYAIDDRDTIDY